MRRIHQADDGEPDQQLRDAEVLRECSRAGNEPVSSPDQQDESDDNRANTKQQGGVQSEAAR